MSFSRNFPSLSGLAFCLLVACSSNGTATNATSDGGSDAGPTIALSRFAMPSSLAALDGTNFFNHPWPSDFRLESDGSLRLSAYPNPHVIDLFNVYATQTKGLIKGFSPAAAGYLSFTAPIDTTLLPVDALASMQKASSLQLVDVDDKSPEKGQRRPIQWKFRAPVGDYYTTTNVLSWAPILGWPLRPATRYAIVATRDLKTPDGVTFGPSPELVDVLAGKGALGTSWKGALGNLAAAGVDTSRIAHLAVFTTSDPVAEMLAVAADARGLPPPTQTDIKWVSSASDGTFDRYYGHYSGSPNYQQGTPPYKNSGGGFVFDSSGKPVKQNDFSLRFLLIVPSASKCPMPSTGYPIVLYAHGTGGDYASFDSDGTGAALAGQCLASMGIDQIFHGVRPGAPAPGDPNATSEIELDFFNFGNAVSARTNPRQAAVDEVARAHFIKSGGLVVDAATSKSGAQITFDPAKIGFFGHSQGGLNGPILFAVDDQTKGGVLSGAGSSIAYSLLQKTKPDPSVAGLVADILAIDTTFNEDLDSLHPAMSLVQTVIDPGDGVHYYPLITHAPLSGHAPKSVLMTEGVAPDGSGDHYAPPRTIESSAIAGKFPLIKPVVIDVPELTKVAGLSPLSLPISGNEASGKATVGLAQFTPAPGKEGHFVVFDNPVARSMAARFSKSVLVDAVPSITAGP